MTRTWFNVIALIVSASLFLTDASCGFNRHLVSIQVVPNGVTFNSVGSSIVFQAMGTYIHPPETQDITNLATWSVDSQNLVTITNTSLVTALSVCGSGNVMASYYDSPNNIFGTAFVKGGGVGTTACNQAVLTVNVTGSGTVADSTQAINCPGACVANYTLGSQIGLTATPSSGATFSGWSNCASVSGNVCTVVLNFDTTVTATFN